MNAVLSPQIKVSLKASTSQNIFLKRDKSERLGLPINTDHISQVLWSHPWALQRTPGIQVGKIGTQVVWDTCFSVAYENMKIKIQHM